MPRQPEQHPGGVPITLALCRARAVAQGRGHGPGSRLWSLIVLEVVFLAVPPPHCSISGSVGGCLPGRPPPQAAFGLLTGALTETPLLLTPDRTSRQALPPGCLHSNSWPPNGMALKMKLVRRAQSTQSHPAIEAKTLLSEK